MTNKPSYRGKREKKKKNFPLPSFFRFLTFLPPFLLLLYIHTIHNHNTKHPTPSQSIQLPQPQNNTQPPLHSVGTSKTPLISTVAFNPQPTTKKKIKTLFKHPLRKRPTHSFLTPKQKKNKKITTFGGGIKAVSSHFISHGLKSKNSRYLSAPLDTSISFLALGSCRGWPGSQTCFPRCVPGPSASWPFERSSAARLRSRLPPLRALPHRCCC